MAVDWIDMSLFGFKKIHMEGFRRMRTSSQIIYETFPQIILQIYIYVKLSQENEELTELGISISAIVVSISLALAHALLESLVILLEAKSAKISFFEYMLVCLTGRFGWVPFTDIIQKSNESHFVDYDCMEHMLCGGRLVYRQDYFFSDETLVNLTKLIN